MAYLQEHKLVDINHSVIDEESSKPAEGIYEFKDKKFVNYRDAEVRPKWRFEWCRWLASNNYAEYNDAVRKWQASKVVVEDGYWPDGLAPAGDGSYQTGDVILIKYPLHIYIKRRKHEIQMSENSTKRIMDQYKAQAAADEVSLDERLMRSL
jgi:hypothetical protein